MQEDFNDVIEFVLEQEEGYTLDPKDPGGETVFGVARNRHQGWEGWPLVDAHKAFGDYSERINADGKIRNLAIELYRKGFWEPCKCNDLPRHFAFIVMDSAVNQGPRVAIRILQITLGVSVDGIIGPKTLAAAAAATPRKVRLALAERLAAYARLMSEKPNLLVFARNWSFRVLSLAKKVDI